MVKLTRKKLKKVLIMGIMQKLMPVTDCGEYCEKKCDKRCIDDIPCFDKCIDECLKRCGPEHARITN